MSVLSDAQIIALWVLEGGSIATAPQALARALSESSGSATVTSSNPDGGTNVGLYQLDTRGVGSGYTEAQLQNPYLNTQVTVKATNGGQNWGEWADNWQDFTSQAESAVASFTNTSANIQSLLASVTTGGAGGKGPSPSSAGSSASSSPGSSLWPSQAVSFFTDADNYLGQLWTGLTALFSPSTYVRAAAGALGALLLLFGLYALGKAVI